jgi:hypothetical protein
MCVCGLSKTMQQKNVRFSDCGKFLFWKNLQLLEDCKKTHPLGAKQLNNTKHTTQKLTVYVKASKIS